MQPAPYFHDVSLGPISASAFWARADDGVRIRYGVWPGGEAGTVLLVPGRTEYLEKYGLAAADLIARGFSVVAVDYRGQGLADRLLANPAAGHVADFSDYQRDIAAVLAALPQHNLPGPLFLLAHSLGGCIGLRAAHERPEFRAVAFSAPMWDILLPNSLSPFVGALTRAIKLVGLGGRIIPGTTGNATYVLDAEFHDNTLTHDKEMWNYMRNQVLRYPDLALGGPALAGWPRPSQNAKPWAECLRPTCPASHFWAQTRPLCAHRLLRRAWQAGRVASWNRSRRPATK